jgi:NitT/TauT family transport system ATP-binding protein
LEKILIQLEHITRFFDTQSAVLDDLSLEVAAGEFITLLGPSGCGKSTLLRLIAGLDRPDSGVVRILSPDHRFGFVFQEAQLLPWRNVLQNVMLPLELIKLPKDSSSPTAEDRCRTVIDRVGLSLAIDKYPAQLSGGMKMRVSVARALVAEPKILLLDEPFAALDENTRFRLQEDLRALCVRENLTVVFVTHSISEAVFLSDRAIVLSDRPARIVIEHRSALPLERTSQIRFSTQYHQEVETLTQAFQKGMKQMNESKR